MTSDRYGVRGAKAGCFIGDGGTAFKKAQSRLWSPGTLIGRALPGRARKLRPAAQCQDRSACTISVKQHVRTRLV